MKSQCFADLLALRTKYGTSELDQAIRDYKRMRLAVDHPERRRRIPPKWVEAAFMRQRGICPRCEDLMQLYGSMDPPVGDHIQSLAEGGKHRKSNIRALHLTCNSSKGANNLVKESKLGHGTIAEQVEQGG